MKYLIAYLVLFLSSISESDMHDIHTNFDRYRSSEIGWSAEKQLTWDDFRGDPPIDSYYSAISATYIEATHGCNEDGSFMFDVRAVFVKELSWSRDKYSRDLLHHEQTHFDITEFYARKIRSQLDALIDPCGIPIEEVQGIVNNTLEELEKAHAMYDNVTVHGLKKKEQEMWDNIVGSNLEVLANYASDQE